MGNISMTVATLMCIYVKYVHKEALLNYHRPSNMIRF